MIIINLSSEDMEYAKRLQSYAEVSLVIKDPKSFSSEELQLIQIGATFAAPVIATVASTFVEMWKARREYSITIGKDTFTVKGFNKKETMELVEKYAPRYKNSTMSDEKMIEQAIIVFLQKETASGEKKNGN